MTGLWSGVTGIRSRGDGVMVRRYGDGHEVTWRRSRGDRDTVRGDRDTDRGYRDTVRGYMDTVRGDRDTSRG